MKKKKKAVIVCGGNIREDFALRCFEKNQYDYRIAADKGLLFFQKNGILPTHIVGDFDSADASCLERYHGMQEVVIRRFQPEKDWTDSEIAAELALELGCGHLDILGGTGSRLDHVLGNVQLLALIQEKGGDGYLLDPNNRIYLRDESFTVSREKQWGKYVSLFAYGGDVTGLTLRGMKYPVENFTLGTVGTRGVSNEITEETGEISFCSGKLLVIESRD